MVLSCEHRKKLRDALIDAFPEKSSLEQMLFYELDKNLNVIADGTSLEVVVFNLIKIAEAQDWVERLISAACNSSPGNPSLEAVAQAYGVIDVNLPYEQNGCDANNNNEQDQSSNKQVDSLVITLSGIGYDNFINDKEIQKALSLLLQRASGFEVNFKKIEKSSIKITLDGNPEGLKRLAALIQSGESDELRKELEKLGLFIENAKLVFKDATEETEGVDNGNATQSDIENLKAAFTKASNQENTELDDNKSLLVQKILKNRAYGRDLRGANLSSTNLSRAYLSGADLSDADLNGTDLRCADLSGTDLRGADLHGTDLRCADLIGANFIGADLSRAYLSGADLCGTYLSGADLRGADLRGADLCGAYLRGADLHGADLCGANLRGADFSSTNLSSTNLSSTNLRGADLSDTDLSGANLRGADLSRTNLSNTIIDLETKLDKKWRLVWEIINQRTEERDLSGADLSSTNLSRAYLSGADLSNADLSSAYLRGTDLHDANVQNARFANNPGISEEIKLDLIRRGAIFEDTSGDHSRVLLPR